MDTVAASKIIKNQTKKIMVFKIQRKILTSSQLLTIIFFPFKKFYNYLWELCTIQYCIFKIDDVQLGFYYTLLIEKEINCQKLTSNLLSNKTATNESLSGPNESMSWYLKCMIGLSDTCIIKDNLEHNNNIKSSGLFSLH